MKDKNIQDMIDLIRKLQAQQKSTMSITTSITGFPHPSQQFKVGDKVTGKPGTHLAGLICYVKGEFLEPRNNIQRLLLDVPGFGMEETDSNQMQPFGKYPTEYKAEFLEPVEEVKKEVKIDFSHLDKVVMADAMRKEIISILTQATKKNILFEEWGLGETIKYGKGMSMLFHGSPGTGKTWCAECIAKAMGTELLTVNVGDIQSSEPGAANRNLTTAFQTASENHNVLFLDECDGLITDRRLVGMILGGEINTLLTEIERFEGVVILSTNRIETLDPALERRLALIMEFPKPSKEQRLRIWTTMIPKKLPLASDVHLNDLAEHKLTGGLIKNVILNAARLALSLESKEVNLAHFTQAIERVQKSQGQMGHVKAFQAGFTKS